MSPQKQHVMHGRDHRAGGSDPIPGFLAVLEWEDPGVTLAGGFKMYTGLEEAVASNSWVGHIGMMFIVDEDDVVLLGCQFYRHADNGSGTAQIRAWNTAGTAQLPGGAASGPSVPGWNEIAFPAPIPLVKDQHYQISWHVPVRAAKIEPSGAPRYASTLAHSDSHLAGYDWTFAPNGSGTEVGPDTVNATDFAVGAILGKTGVTEPGGTFSKIIWRDGLAVLDDGAGTITVDSGGAVAGLPVGGTAGQVLTKDTPTDYDTSWQTPAAGGGGGVTVKDNGVVIGTRAGINFHEGAGILLSFSDDAANNEIDITVDRGYPDYAALKAGVTNYADILA